MEVTKLSSQIKNRDRINIFLNNKYEFSLDISQVIDLAVKPGNIYSEEEIVALRREGEFSKYYTKAMVYSLARPRSTREISDYLYRQTRTKTYLVKGERRERIGMAPELSQRIINKLIEKKYLNDENFARYWVENRNLKKGISERTLKQELLKKGVSQEIVNTVIGNSERNDEEELKKVIAKRRHRYESDDKFIKYLMSKGYQYYQIQEVLSADNDPEVS